MIFFFFFNKSQDLKLQVRNGLTGRLTLKMSGRALEEALPDKGFAEEQLNVLLGPVLCGEALEEHHDLLKVHADELVGPLDEESSADVEVELREALFLGLDRWLVLNKCQ